MSALSGENTRSLEHAISEPPWLNWYSATFFIVGSKSNRYDFYFLFVLFDSDVTKKLYTYIQINTLI